MEMFRGFDQFGATGKVSPGVFVFAVIGVEKDAAIRLDNQGFILSLLCDGYYPVILKFIGT
jgi:hypothetical protein